MDKQEVMAFQTHSNNVKIISEDTTKCYYEKDEYIDGFLTKVKLEENLITTNEDTFDEKFHSYRREGKSSGRATATITFN